MTGHWSLLILANHRDPLPSLGPKASLLGGDWPSPLRQTADGPSPTAATPRHAHALCPLATHVTPSGRTNLSSGRWNIAPTDHPHTWPRSCTHSMRVSAIIVAD